MKRATATLLLLLVVFTLAAVDLNPSAVVIKEHSIDGYNVIKYYAMQEWGTDHGMVLYTINKQCDSCLDVLEAALDETGNFSIFMEAVEYWSKEGTALSNLTIIKEWLDEADFYSIFTMQCDWCMVEYEYNKQVESAGSY